MRDVTVDGLISTSFWQKMVTLFLKNALLINKTLREILAPTTINASPKLK
jgi:hypothetical protein